MRQQLKMAEIETVLLGWLAGKGGVAVKALGSPSTILFGTGWGKIFSACEKLAKKGKVKMTLTELSGWVVESI